MLTLILLAMDIARLECAPSDPAAYVCESTEVCYLACQSTIDDFPNDADVCEQ